MEEIEEMRIENKEETVMGKKQIEKKNHMDGKEGVGQKLWRVSHCDLSAAIILVHHLRRGMPHPGAHACVASSNHRQRVFICTHVRVRERV